MKFKTLLTELISERQTHQKQRQSVAISGLNNGKMNFAGHEACVCKFCGIYFSSAEYLETHIVRRHGRKSVELETLATVKIQRRFADADLKENTEKTAIAAAPEAVMHKIVAQIERALHEHEGRLRSFAQEEAEKVMQMYKRQLIESKQLEEIKSGQLKMEQQREDLQQLLDKMYLQKEEAEDELSDLKVQIQSLTTKKQMLESTIDVICPLPHKCDEAADAKIINLQQIIEKDKAELTSARRELTQVQALHLSALRKKKALAAKLALSREACCVHRQAASSQTERPCMISKNIQTDDFQQREVPSTMLPDRSSQMEQTLRANKAVQTVVNRSCAILQELVVCKDICTNPTRSNKTDVRVQTEDTMPAPFLEGVESRIYIVDDLGKDNALASIAKVSEPILHGSAADEKTVITACQGELSESITQKSDGIIGQILLDNISERTHSAANKVASPCSTVSGSYSTIPCHKFIKNRFQHHENVIEERVRACLAQLDQMSCRFGTPANSTRLSNKKFIQVQQALQNRSETLSSEVLSKMASCENVVSKIIKEEWVPMEEIKPNLQNSVKSKAKVESEISQGIRMQATATFGAATETKQPSDSSNGAKVMKDLKSLKKLPRRRLVNDIDAQLCNAYSIMAPTRRYSAKNQLTVLVKEEA